VWEYYYDEHGKWQNKPREPAPDYTHHCFVVARSARQFFEHATFDDRLPVVDSDMYRRLVRQVLATGPSHNMTETERVVIPGYPNLRSFSAVHGDLLKEECGGAWQSYVQHGHWRMIFPFSRHHQEEMVDQLLADLRQNHPPVVHVVRFPNMTINHAVVVFGAKEASDVIRFSVYDPNNPKVPVTMTYNHETRTFDLPANNYFPGGRVDVYEVYRNWRY
jgi:hypothetical protein